MMYANKAIIEVSHLTYIFILQILCIVFAKKYIYIVFDSILTKAEKVKEILSYDNRKISMNQNNVFNYMLFSVSTSICVVGLNLSNNYDVNTPLDNASSVNLPISLVGNSRKDKLG